MARRLQRTGTRREPRIRGELPWAAALLALLSLTSGMARAEENPPCGTAPDEVRLRLSVSGLHSAAGQVTITVYPDDPKRFLSRGGKLLRVRVPAQAPVTTACIHVPATGYYAISVYHDEDNNQKFNRTLIGLPDEGYGFSNNPKSLIGLPDLKDVRVPTFAGDNTIPITITY